jgi:glycerophosphoryl diester phosphodiesterase
MPTLEELFVTFPEARFNIDPKVDAVVGPLGDLVERLGAIDRIGIGSFDDRRIARLQERFGPALCTSPGPVELLTNLGLPEWSDAAFDSHACLQVPSRFAQHQITAAMVDRAHDLDLQVHVWTINDREEMHQLLDLGVDAIISDELELLLAVLAERADGDRSPETKGST